MISPPGGGTIEHGTAVRRKDQEHGNKEGPAFRMETPLGSKPHSLVRTEAELQISFPVGFPSK
jgi:hypothetical protein